MDPIKIKLDNETAQEYFKRHNLKYYKYNPKTMNVIDNGNPLLLSFLPNSLMIGDELIPITYKHYIMESDIKLDDHVDYMVIHDVYKYVDYSDLYEHCQCKYCLDCKNQTWYNPLSWVMIDTSPKYSCLKSGIRDQTVINNTRDFISRNR